MIGAGTLLYQATGNSGYLYQARQTAAAALAYFSPNRLGKNSRSSSRSTSATCSIWTP